jgi:hypothetical protein
MPLPDWNNDKAKPVKAWSPCSPDETELSKIAKTLRKALVPTEMGATIANSLKR